MANTEKDSSKGDEDSFSTKVEIRAVEKSDASLNVESKSENVDETGDSNLDAPSSTNSVCSGAGADASAEASPFASSQCNESSCEDSCVTTTLEIQNPKEEEEKGVKSCFSEPGVELCKGDKPEKKELPDLIEPAMFSDDSDSVHSSSGTKLLEVILKEGDAVDSGGNTFIPEVQCPMDEIESEGVMLEGMILDTEAEGMIVDTEVGGSDLGLVIGGVVSSFNENEVEDLSLDIDESSAIGTDEASQQAASDMEEHKTYVADFLYSDASNIGPEPDVSGGDESKKGLSLFRFPKIVKSLANVEYSLLQELYKLIYIRNPWDTMEILSKRILDFSGFSFTQDSEDYFTRQVMLRTMAQETLEDIAKLLCLGGRISAESEKERKDLIARILEFLSVPHRRSRPGNKSKENKSASTLPKSTAGAKINRKRKAPISHRRPAKSLKSSGSKSKRRSNPVDEELEVLEDNVESCILEADIKMKLKRTSDQSFCLVPADEDTPKSETKETPEVEKKSESDSSDEDSRGNMQKLQDFPEIWSNIEGTPEKILKEIHYLLYLEDCDMDELKENILQFKGFPSKECSRKHETRKRFLEKMTGNIIKNLVDTFYLMNQSDKDENIDVLLEFLKSPDKDLMKKTTEAPDVLLSESRINLEGLSDSDDSISFEIVTKKVDCIDLISSGDENEYYEPPVKAEPKVEPPEPVEDESIPKKRTLRNFETITKIVNTHPNEYLVDIYNLLYMLPSEQPSTLRKEILDFSGFEFEKGTPEYVRRKQFLDRMQYNSVRRIFNTLIHNSREVRVFSKPTMIGDIFQFLFKLPDTDTSIRLPPPKINPLPNSSNSTASQGLSIAALANLKASAAAAAPRSLSPGVSAVNSILNQSNSKLSELKRVFQRVACFPCEYLIDVHKLLFMKDCEMTEIRQRIFAFKGFPFGVESSEFRQRKMYLEYLTFHSLRKISSVLTTKNVDLRNSTKHELASHLTKVLMEYTDMKPSNDTDSADAKGSNEQINSQKAAVDVTSAKGPSVENIVVTPTVEKFTGGKKTKVCSERQSPGRGLDLNVASSTPVEEASSSSSQNKGKYTPNFERVITPTVLQGQAKAQSPTKAKAKAKAKPQGPKTSRRKKSSPSQTVNNMPAMSNLDQLSAMQFQDIHLPEVEKLVKNYKQGSPALRDLRPKNMMNNPHSPNFLDVVRCNYQSILEQQAQQMAPPYPVSMSVPRPAHPVPFQIVPPFQTQSQMSNMYFPAPPHPMVRPMEMFSKEDEAGGGSDSVPVECILTEGPESGEQHNRNPSLAQLVGNFPYHPSFHNFSSNLANSQTNPAALSKGSAKSPQNSHSTNSLLVTLQEDKLQMKIRDAMTKGSEDEEEDCDKPLATLVGHPNDKVLKQQICGIVENTNLQDITINGVIQKIFNMYPKYNLNYRKEFIKSTLRSLLYRLGETGSSAKSPDSSVSTTDLTDTFSETAPSTNATPPTTPESWSKMNNLTPHKNQKR